MDLSKKGQIVNIDTYISVILNYLDIDFDIRYDMDRFGIEVVNVIKSPVSETKVIFNDGICLEIDPYSEKNSFDLKLSKLPTLSNDSLENCFYGETTKSVSESGLGFDPTTLLNKFQNYLKKYKPIQKVLFGSPGTGKSFKVREIAKSNLRIKENPDSKFLENTVQVVFHPEYTYFDFMGKLIPQTAENNQVIYKFFPGHFQKALGIAYREILRLTNKNALLIIDELNRGNAAAIFGSVFQLLDRSNDHWSAYEIDISEQETLGIFQSMGYHVRMSSEGIMIRSESRKCWDHIDYYYDYYRKIFDDYPDPKRVLECLQNNKISIPKNLSIICTINTSDESIYYMDSAFKRRWDWEYIDINYEIESVRPLKIQWETNEKTLTLEWSKFLEKLNEFIKNNHKLIMKIEGKPIGLWFLKSDENNIITQDQIKNKLMFYLWDSVFSRDKKPLEELIEKNSSQEIKLSVYSDFISNADLFVFAIVPKDSWTEL
ncbi:MAG: restriction endonuclease [Limnoraphis robusta]|jgi:5-methylcytosine-specific restriction protein B